MPISSITILWIFLYFVIIYIFMYLHAKPTFRIIGIILFVANTIYAFIIIPETAGILQLVSYFLLAVSMIIAAKVTYENLEQTLKKHGR